MCKSPFLWGMAAGIMVGVTAEMIVCPRPKCRKTAVARPCSGWVTLWTR